jgi:hypothetical protein
MRGLTKQEFRVLQELASFEGEEDITGDDAQVETLRSLQDRGLVHSGPIIDADGNACELWDISPNGRLALRVCTVTG